MGRIIKGTKDGGVAPVRPSLVEPAKPAEGGRVIEKDVYRAQLSARDILKEGEQTRRKRLEEARKMTEQVKEEAMATGAVEGFSGAAQKAIEIYAERSKALSQVEGDIRSLADGIVQKILGSPLHLDAARQDQIVQGGLHRLRLKRRLTLQCSLGRIAEIEAEDAALIRSVEQVPDIDLIETENVRQGYLRIVTDAGNALCKESVALAALKTSLA